MERFEEARILSPESIAAFARLAGDANPIHHDAVYAARTRLGGIVASGPQLSALMMGLCATHFSRKGGMLGLDFRFRFRRPVRPGVPLRFWWQVATRSASPKLGGELVLLAGQVVDEAGDALVKAAGKVLVVDAL